MKKRTAFSVAEVVVALVIISVFLAATLPSFTGKKNASKGTDYSTRTCIVKENASSVDTTTAPPFDTEFNSASADCKTVISNTAKNIGQSFDTLVYYSTEGTAAEQAAADKVIRAACDMGAVEACKYFIRRCSGDSTKCDISTTANNNDLHYYLTLVSNDLNPGRLVIMKEILPVYYSGEANLKAEVLKTCATGTGTACSLLAQSCGRSNNCSDVVTACNASDVAAADQNCQAGYNANINRTCTTIKQKTATTTDGAYHLTNDTNGDGKSFLAYCDMNTEGGGWTLVRRIAPSQTGMFPNDDNLAGTSAYQTYYANPTQNATFSMKFDNYPFDEMRFATGDNARWLIVDKTAVYSDWSTNGSPKEVRIKKSYLQNSPYNVRWFKRIANPEDPLISARDHHFNGIISTTDNDTLSMLYEETTGAIWDFYKVNNNGVNVWVRSTGINENAVAYYRSCGEIRNKHRIPSATEVNGIYTIDPDGPGGVSPFDVFCDMTTDGGGWTLVASYANGNYFSSLHGLDGGTIKYAERLTAENKYKITSSVGSVSSYMTSDTVLPSYYTVPFSKQMFYNDQGEYVSYAISGKNTSNWFTNTSNGMNPGAGTHSCTTNACTTGATDIFEPISTNLPVTTNPCNALTIRFRAETSDDVVGGPYHEFAYGPTFKSKNNDSCDWDDVTETWDAKRLGGQKNQTSAYILWFVK